MRSGLDRQVVGSYSPGAKMESNTSFWRRLPGANRPIVKKIAGAAFLFFLIKGLIWLGVIAAGAWALIR